MSWGQPVSFTVDDSGNVYANIQTTPIAFKWGGTIQSTNLTVTNSVGNSMVIDYISGNGRISVAGTDAITFYNGGPGGTSLGQLSNNLYGLLLQPVLTSANTSQYGAYINPTVNSSATTAGVGIVSSVNTAAASYAVGTVAVFQANNGSKGAGSTISNQAGFLCNDLINGGNNYGFYSAVNAGTNKWGFYSGGNANNQLGTGQSNVGAIGNASNSNVLLTSGTAPTISSGFGATPSITANGTLTFRLNVGTGGTASTGVVGLPTATNGWNAIIQVFNPAATNLLQTTAVTASSTNSVTLTNYTTSTGAATAWPASTVLIISATAY